jgi:purine-binding chemotaxis protein CheW
VERTTRKQAEEGLYLSFQLAAESYAVPIRSVSEIIALSEVTHVPNMAEYMKGIINLRGRVLPVMDLRRKFQLPNGNYNRQSCIIILEIWSRQVGVVVDSVREVLDFRSKQIEPPPEIGGQSYNPCIVGIGKLTDRIVILCEPNLILSPDELAGHAGFVSVA